MIADDNPYNSYRLQDTFIYRTIIKYLLNMHFVDQLSIFSHGKGWAPCEKLWNLWKFGNWYLEAFIAGISFGMLSDMTYLFWQVSDIYCFMNATIILYGSLLPLNASFREFQSQLFHQFLVLYGTSDVSLVILEDVFLLLVLFSFMYSWNKSLKEIPSILGFFVVTLGRSFLLLKVTCPINLISLWNL